MKELLQLNNITKIFSGHGLLRSKHSGHRAVNDVSFHINKGSVFGLVGESGCGKTTLARSIMMLDPPSSGEILFEGTDLAGLSSKKLLPYRLRMQIVFQDPHSALNPKMSIYNSMKEGLVNIKYPANRIKERIQELLDLVGITPAHMNRFPHEFSGGQKQRIVIARALSMEPEVLILDEPVSSLDVSIQAQIINLLMDLKQKLDLTYLFISHDLNLVAYLSDRIGVMYKGRIIELGDTESIMDSPRHPYTLKLFSSAPGHMEIKEEKEQRDNPTPPAGYSFVPPAVLEETDFSLVSISDSHMVGCYKNIGD